MTNDGILHDLENISEVYTNLAENPHDNEAIAITLAVLAIQYNSMNAAFNLRTGANNENIPYEKLRPSYYLQH